MTGFQVPHKLLVVTALPLVQASAFAENRLFPSFCSPRSLPLNMTKASPLGSVPRRTVQQWRALFILEGWVPVEGNVPVLDFWDRALATYCLGQHPSL